MNFIEIVSEKSLPDAFHSVMTKTSPYKSSQSLHLRYRNKRGKPLVDIKMIKGGTFFVQLYDVAIRMIRSCDFSINQYAVAII